jgi:hypothetical protein
MAYYGQSVNAFLYIGTSTATPLPAPGSDSFTVIPLLETLTPPANETSVGTFNILNDVNKRSVGGKTGDRIVEGTLVIDWTEATHAAMYADSIVTGGQKRNWRIVYPDTNTRQLDFVAFVSKWAEEAFDATGDAKEHVSAFTLAVDGAVTATP